jgi:alkanesulfonate monooxygenase SsuD/methylene tetrahydromethanopterin reductase-like flavin-dependent oxidoreductase (luciferase family)
MQIGIDSFAAAFDDTSLAVSASDRLRNLVEQIEHADQVGLDSFGVGEHHRRGFLDSAPPVILGAAATRTHRIRLTSAVTVLSAADPVRVFQEFATLDLLSHGRAERVVGRGSFIEAFPLFGLRLEDYDSLFAEKLDLLLKIREDEQVHWSGKHRAPLTGQAIYPRPVQNPLPIWLGVGGTPQSFARAGALGLPLMVAIIGGEPRRFRPLIDLYRETGMRSGCSLDRLKVGVHAWTMSPRRRARRPTTSFPATPVPSPPSGRSADGRPSPRPSSTPSSSRMAPCWSVTPKKWSRRSVDTMKCWVASPASPFR